MSVSYIFLFTQGGHTLVPPLFIVQLKTLHVAVRSFLTASLSFTLPSLHLHFAATSYSASARALPQDYITRLAPPLLQFLGASTTLPPSTSEGPHSTAPDGSRGWGMTR